MLTCNIDAIKRNAPQAVGLVKLVCGVANNATHQVMLDAYDHARRHPRYGFKVKQAFRQALAEWELYERRLLHAEVNRMFRVADLDDEARRQFGDITDRDYYDFWSSTGGRAYHKTLPLITSLWNKHRLSLVAHGLQPSEADHVAWVLTAHAAFSLADAMLSKAIDDIVADLAIPREVCHQLFDQFSLARVATAWRRAMVMLEPRVETPMSHAELRNIELGLIQLGEAWNNSELIYDSTINSVEDYDELWRARGFQRKAIRELSEARNEALEAEKQY